MFTTETRTSSSFTIVIVQYKDVSSVFAFLSSRTEVCLLTLFFEATHVLTFCVAHSAHSLGKYRIQCSLFYLHALSSLCSLLSRSFQTPCYLYSSHMSPSISTTGASSILLTPRAPKKASPSSSERPILKWITNPDTKLCTRRLDKLLSPEDQSKSPRQDGRNSLISPE